MTMSSSLFENVVFSGSSAPETKSFFSEDITDTTIEFEDVTFKDIKGDLSPIISMKSGSLYWRYGTIKNIKAEILKAESADISLEDLDFSDITCKTPKAKSTGYCLFYAPKSEIDVEFSIFQNIFTDEPLAYLNEAEFYKSNILNVYSSKSRLYGFVLAQSASLSIENVLLQNWQISGFKSGLFSEINVIDSNFHFYTGSSTSGRLLETIPNLQYFNIENSVLTLKNTNIRANGAYLGKGGVRFHG